MKTEVYSYNDGRYRQKVDVKVAEFEGRIFLVFPFNRKLLAEVKAMEDTNWHQYQGSAAMKAFAVKTFGTEKVWSVGNTLRNQFQLEYLFGRNPYARYDADLLPFTPTRTLYAHQTELARFALTRRQCIWAAEMGTGKTLAAIEVMEASGIHDWWYVAPASALRAVELEFKKWKCQIKPRLITYPGLRILGQEWEKRGEKPPHGLILDESQRVKSPTAAQSQVARQVADGMRQDYDNPIIILMSGSPAPRSPEDWWHQCEIACPGFIREGTPSKFRMRLGLFKEQQSFSGGVFHQRVTWLDDDRKCATCGELESAAIHDPIMGEKGLHAFIPSVNEVAHLYKRMNGLVLTKFKKDCLDLPEKQYQKIYCKPTPDILRAARLISAKAKNVITGLTLLRELSDGFQYKEKADGKIICEICHGTRRTRVGTVEVSQTENANELETAYEEVECPYCDENGQQDKIIREVIQVPCPKEDALRELLDQHFDVGRMVVYAGFTGSVDRCAQIAQDEKWSIIRADGRGWLSVDAAGNPLSGNPLEIFQEQLEQHPRVCFIGQPGAAGVGITLTASPSIVYWSNDFNAESRIQSEDRIHRPGMSLTRGATIYDLIHLPSDERVLANLQAKRDLQSMTLGDMSAIMAEAGDERLF